MTTAMQRAWEMMNIPMNQLPKRAVNYAKHLVEKHMLCGEVLLTAWAHYAQCVEGLTCDDDSYTADAEAKQWFQEHP